jgi:Ulp1 family protease
MNFGRTWSECRLKDINFQEFEVIYPPVPKQRNGYVYVFTVFNHFYLSSLLFCLYDWNLLFLYFVNIRKDCGIHLMKSIELFKPRTSLMGKFSHKDIPDFRIQMANEMMFYEHNEMHEIQEAVMTFKPHVRFFCL